MYHIRNVVAIGIILCLNVLAKTPAEKIKAGESLKIVHVMSFHSPWVWTDQQLQGFQNVLKDINIEYKVVQLNAKKNKQPELEKKGKEAVALINSWKPDLVYATDDAAQQYVCSKFVNTSIPIVFSGVNKKPETYGYRGSKNVIGILEHEHYVPTVKLMQELIPGLKKIAIFSDNDDANASDIYTRIKENTPNNLPGVTIEGFYKFETFMDYKEKILEFNTSKAVDAIVIVMWFKFKDENGNNVDQAEVAKWTVENSLIPDASFWLDRVIKGSLSSVTVSGVEQGAAAGQLARQILVEGKAPSSFEFKPTMKGQPVLNIARAKKLGIKIPSDILLMVKPYKTIEFE